MKISNVITLLRLLLIPLIAYLLYSKKPAYILLSMILFGIATITDWLDGFIARKYRQKSAFGTFFDPIIDKTLILTIFLIFADLNLIPMWIVIILLFRELLVTVIRQNFSTKSKIIGANWMGKSKFFLQSCFIFYTQIFLFLTYNDYYSVLFNKIFIYYFALFITIASIFYAIIFLYWHRKSVFLDF